VKRLLPGRLLESGLWPVVRQRPYHIIARPDVMPKSIFISGFDTAPLAPDYDFVMHNSDLTEFHTGIKALSKLTNGKVNLVLDGSICYR
jgi:Na+-transporting NADH:ubiquinone oxidoreductase subunit A